MTSLSGTDLALICFGLIITFHTVLSKTQRSSWHWLNGRWALQPMADSSVHLLPSLSLTDRTLILFRVAKCQAENSISQAPLERGWPLDQCFISRNLLGGTSGKTSVPGKEAILLSTFAFPHLPVWSMDYSCHPGCHCQDATMALDCSLWACYMGTVSPFWIEPLWLGFCTMQPNMIVSV